MGLVFLPVKSINHAQHHDQQHAYVNLMLVLGDPPNWRGPTCQARQGCKSGGKDKPLAARTVAAVAQCGKLETRIDLRHHCVFGNPDILEYSCSAQPALLAECKLSVACSSQLLQSFLPP